MISAFIQNTNVFCLKLENRFNLLFTSAIIGVVILCFDMLYITPSFEAAYHGLQYSILSNDPFNFTEPNALRYRILPSIIGYVTGLRGHLFFIVPLIFAFLLISTVYYSYRKKLFSPIDSLLFTGLLAFSSTVYIQLQAPGYTDVVFYYFMFLSFLKIKQPVWSAIYFALGMLTHESCIFLLPGLVLYSSYVNGQNSKQVIKYVMLLLFALLPFLAYRVWVSSNVKVEYDLNFYFSKSNISFTLKKVLPYFSVGGFFAFKLFWFFPMYMLYKFRKDKQFVILILTMIVCVFSQLIIAFDITRVICLAFPVLLISAEKMKSYYEPQRFTRLFLLLTIVNFMFLQYFMSADALIPMPPLPYSFLLNQIGIGF